MTIFTRNASQVVKRIVEQERYLTKKKKKRKKNWKKTQVQIRSIYVMCLRNWKQNKKIRKLECVTPWRLIIVTIWIFLPTRRIYNIYDDQISPSSWYPETIGSNLICSSDSTYLTIYKFTYLIKKKKERKKLPLILSTTTYYFTTTTTTVATTTNYLFIYLIII